MAGPLSPAPLGGNLAMTKSNPNQALSLQLGPRGPQIPLVMPVTVWPPPPHPPPLGTHSGGEGSVADHHPCSWGAPVPPAPWSQQPALPARLCQPQTNSPAAWPPPAERPVPEPPPELLAGGLTVMPGCCSMRKSWFAQALSASACCYNTSLLLATPPRSN